jgi:hypothetical protein
MRWFINFTKINYLHYKIEQLQKSVTHYKGNNFGPFGFFCLNFKSRVFGFSMAGLRFLVGTSLITYNINSIIWFFSFNISLIRSKDLFQIHFCLLGYFTTYNGTLPDSEVAGYFQTTFLLGFVGYVFSHFLIPSIFLTSSCEYWGYAVASMSVGVPQGEPWWPPHK